ncbi:hybrid sensor histidine kinase/response regulator [Prosthecobacter fusiformis]|uniref:hybrid sensor histidine kinase/response regulator n=1 Tax=Prosthecobacter fusiformis TaxID=48464 RepID=UPI0014150715|nr:response regulator [Prosthecobacter fusiformis]
MKNPPNPSEPGAGKEQSFPTKSSSFSEPALVLVVDDQARNLQIVKKVLTFDGYQVTTAESGSEALKSIAVRRPDLILLDVVMPEMDGFQVCEQIKENPATHDIPIVFLSADTEHRSIMTAFSKGGIDYVPKPFNKAELLARVRTHVDLYRSQKRHTKEIAERQRTLHIIAHEWHKPLQRIFLFLSKIQDLSDSTLPETRIALSKEATRDTERMLASIEDFLHQQSPDGSATAESSSGWLTTDDLKSMAGKWYVTAKRKLVELVLFAPSVPISIPVAMPFAIHQIVDAVISNAVNFTPQTGRIEVRIFEENQRIVLRVEDEGPGFSDDYLRRKFQPYMRPGTEPPSAALGVGLAAAKRIADRIHATLTIGNRVRADGGGCVTVEFPAADELAQLKAAPAVKPRKASANGRKKVAGS